MKILFAITDLGAASVVTPIAKHFEQEKQNTLIVAFKNTPAHQSLTSAGHQLNTLHGNKPTLFLARDVIQRERPNVVIVGISSADESIDRCFLEAAIELKIPCFVILETWPHRWLEVHGNRDIPLYKSATGIFVPDNLSCSVLQEKGFKSDQIYPAGNPAWDTLALIHNDLEKHRRKLRAKLRIPENALVALFATTLDLETEDYPGNPQFLSRTTSEKEALREFLDATRATRGKIVPMVRQKPGYARETITRLIGNHSQDVIFEETRWSEGGGSYPLPAVDVVFGQATLVLQNSALLGIPTLCYIPDPIQPEPWFLAKIGLNIGMFSKGDLARMIEKIAAEKNCLQGFRSQMLIPTIVPEATSRITTCIELLHELLGRGRIFYFGSAGSHERNPAIMEEASNNAKRMGDIRKQLALLTN